LVDPVRPLPGPVDVAAIAHAARGGTAVERMLGEAYPLDLRRPLPEPLIAAR